MIKHWWTKPASPLMFWLPSSGPIGGCMMGVIVGFIAYWVFH